MIIQHQNAVAGSTVGIENITSFSIENNSKAFHILSNSLYSNKQRAVIRELSCNAYDSHIAAGKKDVPFKMHLPTGDQPWFSVRDYGTGLEDSVLRKVFITYFNSTKTDSNEFIGALGLGSKSPLSIAKEFYINSHYNGTLINYVCFINDDGVPDLGVISTEETTEENGLEVKVFLSDTSYTELSKWILEAKFVLSSFDVKPTICRNVEFTIPSLKETGIGDLLYVETPNEYRTRYYAMQGNVLYEMNLEDNKLFNTYKNMFAHTYRSFILKFNNGELDIAPSREYLSYKKFTIDAIEAKLEKVIKEMRDSFDVKLTSFDTEAKKYSWLLGLNLTSQKSIERSTYSFLIKEYCSKNSSQYIQGTASLDTYRLEPCLTKFPEYYIVTCNGHTIKYKRSYADRSFSSFLNAGMNKIITFAGKSRITPSSVQEYMRVNKLSSALLVFTATPSIKNLFGDSNIIDVAALPKAASKPTVRNKVISVYSVDLTNMAIREANVTEKELIGNCYVTVMGHTVSLSNCDYNFSTFTYKLNSMRQIINKTIGSKKLFIVRNNKTTKMDDTLAKMIKLEDVLANGYDHNAVVEYVKAANQQNWYSGETLLAKVGKHLDPTGKFTTEINKNRYKLDMDLVNYYHETRTFFAAQYNKDIEQLRVSNPEYFNQGFSAFLAENYPMITMVGVYTATTSANILHTSEYITLMDKK